MNVILLLAAAFTLAGPPGEEDLDYVGIPISIENVTESNGTLWIGVYESEADFLNRDKARLVYHRVTSKGSQQVYIDKLVPGKTYAMGVFHDQNDNGELDTNMLGLPSEPWAFSRPVRSWLRKPRFGEMSFVFSPARGLPALRLR